MCWFSVPLWIIIKTDEVRINITSRRVRSTIVAVEKQSATYSECVCVSSPKYLAFKVKVPNVWPVQFYQVYRHYIKNGRIFEKKLNVNVCLDSLYNFCLQQFLF